MDRDRRAAYIILKDIQDNGSWSNLAVGQQFSKEKPVAPAFVREIVYGVLRNQLLLDFNIDRYLEKPKIKPKERILLRMGFYQLSFMGLADHAAINETVALAKALIKGREGFINAVLRSFQRDGKELFYPETDDKNKYYSVKYSAEPSFVSHLVSAYGEDRAEAILAAFNRPARLCIRVNLIKSSRDKLKAELEKQGFECEPSEEADTALFVKGSGLLDTDLYRKGFFSVQGEESQTAIKLLSPKSGELMMDLCAAPGGKTCAAAELMGNQGQIMAFDSYDHRVRLIENEAKRLGLDIIITSVCDSGVYNSALKEKADCVLADVPCSVLGTAGKNPEIKLRKPDLSSLPEIQARILNNASLYVKAGGRLLYSTCTLNPAENEKQIEAFLKDRKDFEKLHERQFFPDDKGTEGFYVCLLRKTIND